MSKNGAEKDILVILTGGTIGSVVLDGVITATPKAASRVVEMYRAQYGDENRFEVMQPMTMLSENNTLETWQKLLEIMRDVKFSDYKGIILTHGTDTLSYTAALLGQALEGIISAPVCLVSSNLALGETDSNGLFNFRAAVQLIDSENVHPGVYVTYHNINGVDEVFLGSELLEADTALDQFGVYGGENFGVVTEMGFTYNPSHEDHCPGIVSDLARINWITSEPEFAGDVLLVRPYVGLHFDKINISDAKAVVVYAYHSGTYNTNGLDSFPAFARKCKQAGIQCYLAGVKTERPNVYASEEESKDFEVLYDCSPEAAYANVLIKLSAKEEE